MGLQNEDVTAAQSRRDFSIQFPRKNEVPNLTFSWWAHLVPTAFVTRIGKVDLPNEDATADPSQLSETIQRTCSNHKVEHSYFQIKVFDYLK